MITKFNTAYNDVFDKDGNIMICGREKCKRLIRIADQIESGIDHGSLETGYMNVKNIKSLHNRLNDPNFL